MSKPKYVRPSGDNADEKHVFYQAPETFEHALTYAKDKDTPIEVESIYEPQPIPVSVVDMPRGPNTVESWVGANFTVQAQSEVTLKREDSRKTLKLTNTDAANPLYVNERSGKQTTGYPLFAGKEITIDGTREVYIWNPHASASVLVGVYYSLITELK